MITTPEEQAFCICYSLSFSLHARAHLRPTILFIIDGHRMKLSLIQFSIIISHSFLILDMPYLQTIVVYYSVSWNHFHHLSHSRLFHCFTIHILENLTFIMQFFLRLHILISLMCVWNTQELFSTTHQQFFFWKE